MTDTRLLDTILIERGQRGDTSAIDELLRKHYSTAFAYAMKMTRHVENAADVVSDGFIRIHRAIDRFQADASFSTWMYKVIRNCFLDSYRKKRVFVVGSLDAGIEFEDGVAFAQPIDESESPFETSVRSAHGHQVRMAIEKLPVHHRKLVLMFYSEDLSYEEIASLLNTPAGTIKSRLNRARVKMKDIIEKDSNLSSLAFSI